MKKTLYRCDPDKNAACRKTGCERNGKSWTVCRATENPDYAVRDENGTPIVEYVARGGERWD